MDVVLNRQQHRTVTRERFRVPVIDARAEAAEVGRARHQGFLRRRLERNAGEVRHVVAVEAPFPLQDVDHRRHVCARCHRAVAVVGGHHAARAGGVGAVLRRVALKGSGLAVAFKRLLQVAQLQLTRLLFVHEHGDAGTVDFLIVEAHVLDVDERALALRALHHRAADIAGQNRVFGVVFHAAGVVRVTVDVHARANHNRQIQHEGRFAEDDFAVFKRQFLVPSVGEVHRRGRNARAGGVIRRIRVGHALIAAFVQVVGVRAAGAVVRSLLRHVDGSDALNVMERIGGEIKEFRDRDLVDQLFPARVIVRRVLHVVDGERRRGVAEDEVGHVVIGLEGIQVVVQQAGNRRVRGQTGIGLGERAVPVGAAQVGHRAGLKGVVIHGVVAFGQLVGDGRAVLAHGEGGLVHIARPRPLVGLCRVAVGGHAVRDGLALRRKHVVQRVMRVRADGEVVVAGVDDVGLGAIGVVGGEVRQINLHGDGLGCAGLQRRSLFKVHQLHSGLFHAVLAVIVGVRHACVHFHDALARHVAGILHSHGDGRGLLVIRNGHAVQRLLEGGVGQTVAEGIDDFVGVIPCAVLGGDGAVSVGVGASLGFRAAVAQHNIGIAGFVVAVAGVDAFRLNQVGVDIRFRREVRRVRPRDVAVVRHSGREGAVLRHHVAKVRGGRDGAVEHVRHAGEADPDDCVDVRVVLQVGDFHRVRGVDQHDDLVEVRLRLVNHRHFLVREGEDVAGNGADAFRQTVLAGIVAIAGFAAGAADDDDCRVAVFRVILAEISVQGGQLV